MALSVYPLIIKQLLADGHVEAASAVAQASKTQADMTAGPSLAHIVQSFAPDSPVAADTAATTTSASATTFPPYQAGFVTQHKDVCRVARYSHDGQLIATGGADFAVKLLDVGLMNRLHALKAPNARHLMNLSAAELDEAINSTRPVVKTYIDHQGPVNDVDFHPTSTFVASASRDCTIGLFDYARPTKKMSRKIDDVFSIRSIHFHPSGDFLLVGTEDPVVRIYDVNTLQAYLNPQAEQHHTAALTMVRWSPRGDCFVTSSRDGSIKVWDTVSCQCVRTIRHAHSGASVSSICFNARGTQILSSGQDNSARLYDLASGALLTRYDGGGHSRTRLNATFSPCGEFVMMPDERSRSISVWRTDPADTENTPLQFSSQHTRSVKFIAASPCEQNFVTCSEDTRGRFWFVPDQALTSSESMQ